MLRCDPPPNLTGRYVRASAAAIEQPAWNKTVEKVVRVFDTFEEADAADALSRAQMTPQQRTGIFFELRERASLSSA
jgi:flagellar motility protein MotE (MotC chaperone)